MLNGELGKLRNFFLLSTWIVRRCKSGGHPTKDTNDNVDQKNIINNPQLAIIQVDSVVSLMRLRLHDCNDLKDWELVEQSLEIQNLSLDR